MKFKKLICIGMTMMLVGSSLPQRTVQAQEMNQQNLQNFELQLEDVVKAEQNQTEQWYGNFKYKEQKDGTLEITDYKQENNDKEVVIPAEIKGKKVTSIGSSAFRGCNNLSSISVPKGVTSIGGSAFRGCSKLSSIHLPNGVTKIGQYAFASCKTLKSINLPEGLISIEEETFSGCSNLSSISLPEGLTSIRGYAFYNCSKLSNIHLPKGITLLESEVFCGCSGLKEIIVDENNITYASKDGILYAKDMKTLICCPEGKTGEVVVPEEVTKLEEYAFSGCSNLSTIILSKKVTSIGSAAFEGCSNLSSIHLPEGVTDLGDRVFSGCSSLSDITVPEGVTEIKPYAFSDCINLSSIHLPKKGSIIGQSAFSGCINLSSITIPEGVTSIEESAFFRCMNLNRVNIPKEVTLIGEEAFLACSSLKSITIPEKVTFIGYDAFEGCSSLKEIIADENNMAYISKNGILYNKDMTELFCCPGGKTGEVVIPEGVTTIGICAFSECSNLSSISIPKEVTTIGLYAFENCSSNLVLMVTPDSYAETYAKENHINYCYIGECPHTYQSKLTKATTKKNGSIKKICSKCGVKKGKATVIYAAKNVKLSKTSFTYNNKIQKPSITVKDSKGKVLKKGKDYTITYPKNMKNVGKYMVTIQLKGNYKGTIKKSFTIKPKVVNIAKITAKSKSFTIKWKKQTQQVTGYQISYSTSKKFVKKDTKTTMISNAKTTTKPISKLKAKKKYYVRIRTYKTIKVDGESTKLYSNWSKVKTITTKK